MNGLIFKVLIASTLVAIAVRYGGPVLPVSGTTATVLIAVLSPTILMAAALGWRWQRVTKGEE
jgi:hypothetical protein